MVKTNLAKNTILLSAGTLLTNILQFVMVPFFSSWLSTSDYGAFDLCITYVALLMPIINLASGEAVFRYSLDANDEDRKKHISNGLAIVAINTVIFSCILCVVTVITKKFLLIAFIALLIGQLLNSYCQSFLRGIKKLNIYSVGNAVTTVFISMFVTILVWGFKLELYGIVLGYAIGYLLGDIFLLCISKFKNYFSWADVSIQGMKELIAYSYPLIPNNVCWWIINASDRMVINIFLGSTANGIFAIAHKIPNVCSSVFGMFNISWQESASEVVNLKERNAYYNSVYNNTTAVLISLCTGVLSLNFLLYDYIFDAKYYEAALYTPILVLAIIFSSLAQFYGGIMISLKMPKANGITTIIGAMINIVLHIGLVYFIGLYAAALSTLFSNLTLVAIRRYKLRQVVHCKWNMRVCCYWLVLIYMFIMAYINLVLPMRIVNFFVACILFVFVNWSFLNSFLNKLIGHK